MRRWGLAALVVLAMALPACTNDGGNASPTTTTMRAVPIPESRKLAVGRPYAMTTGNLGCEIQGLNGQDWEVDEVYTESPFPVSWLTTDTSKSRYEILDWPIMDVRLKLVTSDELQVAGPQGVFATFRSAGPYETMGCGSDTMHPRNNDAPASDPIFTSVGADCPPAEPPLHTNLFQLQWPVSVGRPQDGSVELPSLSRAAAARWWVWLRHPDDVETKGDAPTFAGTQLRFGPAARFSPSPPKDVVVSADQRVGKAVEARLHDGKSVVLGISANGPVTLADAIDGQHTEPLVGCVGLRGASPRRALDTSASPEWPSAADAALTLRGAPPTEGLTDAQIILSLSGFVPRKGATLESLTAWATAPRDWSQVDPRFRFFNIQTPASLRAKLRRVAVHLYFTTPWTTRCAKPPASGGCSSENMTLALWTAQGWSTACVGGAGQSRYVGYDFKAVPNEPIEIVLTRHCDDWSDAIVLGRVNDPLAGETFDVTVDGSPTLEQLRQDPTKYAHFTCCRPEWQN